MSNRSGMSIVHSFPDILQRVLEYRANATTCPDDVEHAMASIAFFNSRVQNSNKQTSRFGNLTGSSPTNRSDSYSPRNTWRGSGAAVSEDGFETVSRGTGMRRPRGPANYSPNSQPPSAFSSATDLTAIVKDTSGPAKFSSASIKAAGDIEDRILARVKGKINKIGFSTYDATKVFMQQILNSDETDFLDEFMKFVFQKAATESAFCGLYARLLHELADEFPHLIGVMEARFNDYSAIFTEVEVVPDASSSAYRAFVEAQESKKFRRGYSQFVAELVKVGRVEKEPFGALLQQIVLVLETLDKDSEKTLLCEEYIDCLATMCTSASDILRTSSWGVGVKMRLKALVAKPKADVPGLTNKARFALMDLVDAADRGWK